MYHGTLIPLYHTTGIENADEMPQQVKREGLN